MHWEVNGGLDVPVSDNVRISETSNLVVAALYEPPGLAGRTV